MTPTQPTEIAAIVIISLAAFRLVEFVIGYKLKKNNGNNLEKKIDVIKDNHLQGIEANMSTAIEKINHLDEHFDKITEILISIREKIK